MDINLKAKLRWNSLSISERTLYQKDSKLIKKLVTTDIAKLREEAKSEVQVMHKPVARRNNLIKNPMNVSRLEPGILVPKSTNLIKKSSMGYQMRMESNTMQPPTNDYEGATLASMPGNEEYNSPYTKIFADGMEPPILDQRNKRDRRLSSIIGVKTNGYGKDFEVEELMDPLSTDPFKQDNRKISLDYLANNIAIEEKISDNLKRGRRNIPTKRNSK